MILATFQNFVQDLMGIVGMPVFLIGVLGYLKEILLPAAILRYIFRIKLLNTSVDYLWLFNILISLFFFFVVSVPWKVPLLAKLMDLRTYLVSYMIYLVGRVYSSRIDLSRFMRRFTPLIVLVFVIGMIEWLFISRSAYMQGFLDVSAAKGASIDDVSAFLYKVQYGGLEVKRMMSVFMNPLGLAYFLIVPLCFYFSRFQEIVNRRTVVLFSLVAIMVLLSATRAVVFAAMLVFLFDVFSVSNKKAIGFVAAFVFIILVMTPVSRILSSTINLQDPRALATREKLFYR